MNSVGERLREARLAKGLTQEQLARGLATKGFISQVERNRATPSLPKLRVLAERLGQPLSFFVTDRPPQLLTLLRKSAQLAVRAEDPAGALDILAEASDLPATANERADLQRLRGVALSELRRNRDALSTLQDAAATAPFARIRHERTANRIINKRGDVHYAAGRKREAAELQRRCLQRARELKDDFEIGVAAGALARYALEEGKSETAVVLARESQQAAGRSGDHLHQAVAAAVEGAAADRLGRRRVANQRFTQALQILFDRSAAVELAEVCTMYADILRWRGQDDRAFAFMRMAAERDFGKLASLLKAGR